MVASSESVSRVAASLTDSFAEGLPTRPRDATPAASCDADTDCDQVLNGPFLFEPLPNPQLYGVLLV